MLKYRNFTIIISSPSGAGKSTVVKKVREWDKKIGFSVSATTRAPRAGEVDGVNYHFFSVEEFKKRISDGDFLEYAQVFDNYYGTLKSEIEAKFKEDCDVMMDIDWQGAQQMSQKLDKNRILKIFILPPSLKELENRLRSRGLDSAEVIEKRLAKAKDEINHCFNYDYVIVNDDLDKTVEEVKSIITTKRFDNMLEGELRNFVENI